MIKKSIDNLTIKIIINKNNYDTCKESFGVCA